MVANLAVHVVFFFERRLDMSALDRRVRRGAHQPSDLRGANGRSTAECESDVRAKVCPSLHDISTARSPTRSVRRRRTADSGSSTRSTAPRHDGGGGRCASAGHPLGDDATAIGLSWHHAIGDMQTLMVLMNGWAAAAAGEPLAEPLIVEDRAAYLDEHLPADGAQSPGRASSALAEFARSALYLAKDAASSGR